MYFSLNRYFNVSSHTSLIFEENIASENKLSNSDIHWNKNEQTKIINNVSSSHSYSENYEIIVLNTMTIHHRFTVSINFLPVLL